MAATSFFAQASANRRNSFLLALFVVAILGLLGFVIGYAIVGDPSGGVAATGAALLLGGLIAARDVLPGRQARPRRVRCTAGRRTDGAAADERRPGDGHRGEHPDAGRLHHRRLRPECVRDRARSEARLDGDHDGTFGEARSRGAAGRHRPRAVARPELRHPLRADRRRHGRCDRDPRGLLPALHVLGRRRAAAATAKVVVPPRRSSSPSRSCSPSWRRSSRGSSSLR